MEADVIEAREVRPTSAATGDQPTSDKDMIRFGVAGADVGGLQLNDRHVARNTLLNLAGRLLPMLVAFMTIPFLTAGLGLERFGILTLAWLVVGYFGIFDLGVGRATTKFVAEALARNRMDRLPLLVWTSLLLLVGFGVVAAIVALFVIPPLVAHVLNIPVALTAEARSAFLLLAISIPLVFGTSGARGVLEGQQRFRLENTIKVFSASFNFIGPLLVLPFSTSLVDIVVVLIAGRIVVFAVHLLFVVTSLPGPRRIRLPDRQSVRTLLGFGGWLTLTNLLGSVMALGYVDRLVISATQDMAAVAYYATPFELLSKLLVVSGALLASLFPVFSAYSLGAFDRLRDTYRQAGRFLLLGMTALSAVMIAFAEPFLHMWLGADFAQHSTLPLQLLAVGVLVGSVAILPLGAIQALGRPDLTAKRHAVELPLYCLAMWLCVTRWGIVGAAAVWTAYIAVDAAVLYWLLHRILPAPVSQQRHSTMVRNIVFALVTLCGAFLLSQVSDLLLRAAICLTGLTFCLVVFWKYLFDEQDRNAVFRFLIRCRAYVASHRGARYA